jgi:hypothetical protein
MTSSATLLAFRALTIASSALGCGGATDESIFVQPDSGSSAPDAALPGHDVGVSTSPPSEAGRSGADASTESSARDAVAPAEEPKPDTAEAGVCPTTSALDGQSCDGAATCLYDGRVCTCPPTQTRGDAGRVWSCFTATVSADASACPSARPHTCDACSIEGLSCRYGRAQCFCGGRRDAAGPVWDCP